MVWEIEKYMPKVSVIIPTYNLAKYLPEAIESVLNQTFKDIEIIVVDDGSLDNEKEIVSRYAGMYPDKIRYFRQQNQGVSIARNKGIMEARGEYIAFLDEDDMWEPKKIEKQIRLFNNDSQISLVFTNAFILKNGCISGSYIRPEDKDKINQNIFYNIIMRDFIPFCSVMVRCSALKPMVLFDPTFPSAQDMEWLLRVIYNKKVGYIDEHLATYRVHDKNVSRKLDMRHRENIKAMKINLSLHPEIKKVLGKKIDKLFSKRYFDYGYALFEKNEFTGAREQFINSFKCDPVFSFCTICYFIVSLLPLKIINRIREANRSMRALKKIVRLA